MCPALRGGVLCGPAGAGRGNRQSRAPAAPGPHRGSRASRRAGHGEATRPALCVPGAVSITLSHVPRGGAVACDEGSTRMGGGSRGTGSARPATGAVRSRSVGQGPVVPRALHPGPERPAPRLVRSPAARVVPRGWRRSGTGTPGAPRPVPSHPTKACRRRRPVSARASLPLPAAPDARRSASASSRIHRMLHIISS